MLLLGGSTCYFCRKDVPYFVRWSEKGSISLTILTGILKEIDSRQLFPRTEGRVPFLLLDGYGSRTKFKFLEYVNDEKHK